jgi:hypothetical protein
MISNLINRIVCKGNDKIDTWMEIVPFLIFAAIWIISVIAKAAQSKSGKKGQEQKPRPRGTQLRPELEDFVRMVKERYAQAREEAKKSYQQREYTERTISAPTPSAVIPPAPQPAPMTPQPAGDVSKPYQQREYIERTIPPPPSFIPPTVDMQPEPIPPDTAAEQLKQEISEPSISIFQQAQLPLPSYMPIPEVIESRPSPYLSALKEQITQPDGLRKAILYSEIFGRPVGLRDN